MILASKRFILPLFILFSSQITQTSPVKKCLIGAASAIAAAVAGDCVVRYKRHKDPDCYYSLRQSNYHLKRLVSNYNLKGLLKSEGKEIVRDAKYFSREVKKTKGFEFAASKLRSLIERITHRSAEQEKNKDPEVEKPS